MNETDQKWTVLFDEIDELLHWMVQQESKEILLKNFLSLVGDISH